MTDQALVVEKPTAVLVVEGDRAPPALVVVEEVSALVASAEQGPSGPPGDGNFYRHRQEIPSAIWIVPHNLGHQPFVVVTSVGGMVLLAAVIHLSDNVLQIVLDDPLNGVVTCL